MASLSDLDDNLSTDMLNDEVSSDDELVFTDDYDEDFGDLIMFNCFVANTGSTIGRTLCRTSLLTGKMYMLEILNGHPDVHLASYIGQASHGTSNIRIAYAVKPLPNWDSSHIGTTSAVKPLPNGDFLYKRISPLRHIASYVGQAAHGTFHIETASAVNLPMNWDSSYIRIASAVKNLSNGDFLCKRMSPLRHLVFYVGQASHRTSHT
ncbi:hypothetical protein Fot_10933 [Forsythia ovata]|uniref:Uncharacterized protein n=1 Tax=Forsythia ovata TaxID=205694 RepID=A0ABD1WI95_9LAMI